MRPIACKNRRLTTYLPRRETGESMQANGTSDSYRTLNRLAAIATAFAVFLSFAPLVGAHTAPEPDTGEGDVIDHAEIEYEVVRIGGTFEFPWSIAFLPAASLCSAISG